MAEKQIPEEDALSKLFKKNIRLVDIPGDAKQDLIKRVLFENRIRKELESELGRTPTDAELDERLQQRNEGEIY